MMCRELVLCSRVKAEMYARPCDRTEALFRDEV